MNTTQHDKWVLMFEESPHPTVSQKTQSKGINYSGHIHWTFHAERGR